MPRKHRDQDVNTRLLDAVRSGSYDKTREMIRTYGLSYSSAWAGGYTLLCTALEECHTEIARLLLSSGSRVNCKSNATTFTESPLHYAVANGERGIVNALLSKGARVNDININGQTPLHHAISTYRTDIIDILISHGADVNAIDYSSVTPLLLAIHLESSEVIQQLLDHGACVNYATTSECEFSSREGYTPLLAAVEKGNEEIVRLLLGKSVDVNAVTDYGSTPLHIACSEGYDGIAELLLNQGAQVDCVDENGKSALLLAVEGGYLKIVEDILKHIPDMKSQSHNRSIDSSVLGQHDEVFKKILGILLKHGVTVNPDSLRNPEFVHGVIREGYTEIVLYLLQCGIDVDMISNSSPDEGFTPLHSATKYRQNKVAELLLKHGANINIRDKSGKTPLFYALEDLDPEILDILLMNSGNAEIDFELLKMAIDKGCVRAVETLLQHGANVNMSDEYGRTALIFNSLSGEDEFCECIEDYPDENSNADIKGEICKLLLSKGAHAGAQISMTGATALHAAAQKGYIQVVQNLLAHNVDVNVKREDEITAIQLAVYNGHTDIVELLLEHSATCESTYYQSSILGPPLLLAANLDFEETAEVLLRYGADVNCKDKYGRTALHLASSKGYLGIVRTLLKYWSDINILSELTGTPIDYAMSGKDLFLSHIYYSDSESDISEDDYSYLDEPSWSVWDKIIHELKRHIVKLRTAGLHVCERNLLSFDDGDDDEDELQELQDQCQKEIAQMIEEKIDGLNFSFYDVIKNTRHLSTACLKNDDAAQMFESSGYDTKFPIYAILMKSSFMKALRRNELLKQSYEVIQTSSQSFRKLTYDCIEKIFNHMSDEDLNSLVGKCERPCVPLCHESQEVTAVTVDVSQMKLPS